MATSPAPICSSTKSKIFLTSQLTSKVWLLAVMDRTQEDAPKRRERPRRQLNSHFLPKPLKQGNGPGHGERAVGVKITVRMGNTLLGSSVNDFQCFGRKKKLKIDCNFQFSIFRLQFLENRKTKPCHRLQHCRKSKIAAQFHFSLYCRQD